MRVLVDLETASVVLADPQDFRRLHVEVHAAEASALGDADGGDPRSRVAATVARAGAGHLEGNDVLLGTAWLRTSGDDGSEGWSAGFEAMLDYAEAHGWTASGRDVVRAHVVWPSGLASG